MHASVSVSACTHVSMSVGVCAFVCVRASV